MISPCTFLVIGSETYSVLITIINYARTARILFNGRFFAFKLFSLSTQSTSKIQFIQLKMIKILELS